MGWQRVGHDWATFTSPPLQLGHVWMWDLDYKEDWVLKNWCFRTVVLEKLLRVPWTARRSNKPILNEISPEYLLEGLMLKLKLQHFGNLMWRIDSLEKTLMMRKIEGRKRRGRPRIRWLSSPTGWTSVWESSRSWWWTGKPDVLPSTGSQRVRHERATELADEFLRSLSINIYFS